MSQSIFVSDCRGCSDRPHRLPRSAQSSELRLMLPHLLTHLLKCQSSDVSLVSQLLLKLRFNFDHPDLVRCDPTHPL